MSDCAVQIGSPPSGRVADDRPALNETAPPGARRVLRLAVSPHPDRPDVPSLASEAEKAAPGPAARQSAQWLAIAELLDGWAAALPRWDGQGDEPWYAFAERAYEAETALAERLRRLPTGRLTMCPTRDRIDFALAGISVSTERGLGAACRAWAHEARVRA